MDNKQSAYLKNKTTVSTFSMHSFRKPEASQTAIEKGKLYAKIESHKSRVLKELYNKKYILLLSILLTLSIKNCA
jgi:hypothetical protein